MPVPPFESSGDLPEGLHQADLTEFFMRFGRGTAQRERVATQLRQAFELVRPPDCRASRRVGQFCHRETRSR
jgi:hypothetical protein